MIQKSSRKSTYRLLLVVTLLLGVLTLSGCITTATPSSSAPVSVVVSPPASLGPKENLQLTVTVRNNSVSYIRLRTLSVVSTGDQPGSGPFTLWSGRTADLSAKKLLGIIPTEKTSPAVLVQQSPMLVFNIEKMLDTGIGLAVGESRAIVIHLTEPTGEEAPVLGVYKTIVRVSYEDYDNKNKLTETDGTGVFQLKNRTVLPVGIRWIIEQLYKLVHNYALAIILLTLGLKLITEPLTRMQFKSTVDMQKLQPQLAKLKAKYPNKEDAKQLNEETMKLYKDNNVNLFSGCLPLLVQWPVFLALFTAINNYSPFNSAPFLWAPALSMTSSGLPLATGFIMPIIVGVSTYVQSITSFIPGQDRSQMAMLTYFMPILLAYWAYNFSIALALYWALFSLFSAGQQYLVIRRLTKGMALPEPVVKKSAKKK